MGFFFIYRPSQVKEAGFILLSISERNSVADGEHDRFNALVVGNVLIERALPPKNPTVAK